MTGVRLHDYGCTLKAYRGDLARSLMLYGEMHRFVPAIAARAGRAHRRGRGEFPAAPRRRIEVRPGPHQFALFWTLLTVKFLSGYSTRPIQVFGAIGLVLG